MNLSKQFLISSIFFGLFTISSTTVCADEKPAAIIPQTELKWTPLPGMPRGVQISMLMGDLKQPQRYTFLLKLPDGYVIPPHWHSNDEETTVISGTLLLGFGDKINNSDTKALKAGSFAIVPGHMHHYVSAEGETIIQDSGMGPRDTIFVNPDDLKVLIEKAK